MRSIPLTIATAHSKRATQWKNKKTTWAELLKRMETTTRTYETVAEYKAMSKDEQDRIKDVGGFVGAYLKNGVRKAANVEIRSCGTLDIDFGDPDTDIWGDFIMRYDFAAAMYSTHKHTPEAPRLRLVFPFSRPVAPEEYEPIVRAIAGDLGIEQFDDTTYDINRLFFWPSTSKDGEFVFQAQEGPALDPDEILGQYHDWRDSSEWPHSSREGEKVKRSAKKQGDPLEKPGMIGAFCRCYSIEEAIQIFLSDVYEPTAIEGRYTYKNGTVAAGLVVYDGKFAYANNATDPASQTLCNAFDLVRVHLFGMRDDGYEEQAINRRPSFSAMEDLARNDKRVKRLLTQEKGNEALGDFDDVETTSWADDLEYRKDGKLVSSMDNMIIVLMQDPALKGKVYRDIFTGFTRVTAPLPWDNGKRERDTWTNDDEANLRVYLDKQYGMTGKEKIRDAFVYLLTNTSVHPIRDYLRSLSWDGKERLDTLLTDYLGAVDSQINRVITRMQFCAAIARVFEPGCKYDYVLTITGKEGLGKTTLIQKMGGIWFSNSLTTMDGKEGMEALRGVWLMELGELIATKHSEVEMVKNFISKQTDTYRPAYGMVVETFPRQNIFFATTNEEYFLKGDTGSRRFLPVKAGQTNARLNVWEDLTEEVRDQIWAEAYVWYKRGTPRYLSPEMEKQARELQDAYNEINAEDIGGLVEYLDTKLPEDWNTMSKAQRRSYFLYRDKLSAEGTVLRTRVCAMEIMNEFLPDYKGFWNTQKVRHMMKRVPGWRELEGKQRMGIYGVQRVFERVEIPDEDDDL